MYSALALFCEDIREEKSGMDTLVGLLPDNVQVPSLPFVFPRLCVYLRINLPVESDSPETIEFWLTAPFEIGFPRTTIDPNIVEKARREAKEAGSANGGTINKGVMTLLRIKSAGRMNLMVRIDDQEFTAGTLNIRAIKQSATAKPSTNA